MKNNKKIMFFQVVAFLVILTLSFVIFKFGFDSSSNNDIHKSESKTETRFINTDTTHNVSQEQGLISVLEKLLKEKDCLDTLYKFEVAGLKDSLDCGITSGVSGKGESSKKIEKDIADIQKKIEAIQTALELQSSLKNQLNTTQNGKANNDNK